MTTWPVTTATAADAARIVAVLGLAFSADPVVRWIYPDPQQYLTAFPAFVQAFAGRAFEQGTANFVGDYAGAALWLPPGAHPDEDALGAVLRRTVAAPAQAATVAVLEQMGQFHPSTPHWYLPLLGVDPTGQRQGCGTALLRHALAVCDRDGTLAYLESSNPRSTPLYERHGFTVVGTIQGEDAPPLWPMVRRPR